MQLSTEFWVQILAMRVPLRRSVGRLMVRIQYLEQKMDKHNNLVERVYQLEASEKNAHHRIDELREEMLR